MFDHFSFIIYLSVSSHIEGMVWHLMGKTSCLHFIMGMGRSTDTREVNQCFDIFVDEMGGIWM